MKLIKISNLFLVAIVSILNLGFIGKALLAQTELEVPIDDQARYLQNLRSPSREDWKVTQLSIQEADPEYQLQFQSSEYQITEQHSPDWRNTAYNHNYEVTFDVYQFVEEDIAQ